MIPVVALAALLGVGIGAIALTGGGEGDAPEVVELLLEPVASVGRDPFTESVVPRAGGAFDIPVDLQLPDELTAVLGDDVSTTALTSLASAVAGQLNPPVGAAADLGLPELDLPEAASGQVASVAGSAPGLYGGTQLLSVCDKRQLVEFLQGSDEKARAWASTLGIQPSGIPAYVEGLTDVVLQADTRVTNHGFSGGTANPIDSVLQAGTAVLIDAFGVPRVRCYCGNPLTEPRALTTKTPKIVGKKWPGFRLARTVAVKKVKRVDEFAIDDVLTRDGFVFREPGTDATEATLAAGGAQPPAAPPPPPPPPPPVANITAQGNVNASTEFPTGEFPARLAVDGDKSTSWFSAGPDAGGGSTFVWGAPDGSKRFIQTVRFFNNALNSRSDFRTGFGFAQVTVAVLSGSKTVFEKTFALPGTPDPNITVQPKVEGDVVRLFFTGHEFPQCGGISELVVIGRPVEPAEPSTPAGTDPEREQAIALVRSILNENAAQCGGLTVRGISAQPTGNGWRVSADVTTFGNDGTAEWNVIGSRATPAEPLAADIENGCP